jgi:hypothetical protein
MPFYCGKRSVRSCVVLGPKKSSMYSSLEESESFKTLEWAVRLHPDDKDRVFGQLAAHNDHRVPYDTEYRLRTNRGDYLWIRGRGQAIWDEQGKPTRMSGSCQDITDRKQAEHELHARAEQALSLQTALLKIERLDDTELTFSEILSCVPNISTARRRNRMSRESAS